MIRTWIIIILYLVLIVLFAYMNNDWYKLCKKIDSEYQDYIKEINEFYMELLKAAGVNANIRKENEDD